MKKYLNKVKIVEPCDSIISEIPILTAALFWSRSLFSFLNQAHASLWLARTWFLEIAFV